MHLFGRHAHIVILFYQPVFHLYQETIENPLVLLPRVGGLCQ